MPPPKLFFRDVAALPPAHALRHSPGSDSLKSWQYWDIDPEARIRYQDESAYSVHFLCLSNDGVKLRLRSDVAVGSCLSGGPRSSILPRLLRFADRSSMAFPAKSVCRFWIIASPNISSPCPKPSKSRPFRLSRRWRRSYPDFGAMRAIFFLHLALGFSTAMA